MRSAQEPSTGLFGVAALFAALGASLCCLLPVVVAVIGVGSAAAGAALEPLRPWMSGLTALLLAFAFYRAYRPPACAPGETCAVPAGRARQRVLVWAVAIVALLLIAFPYYSSWLF